MGRIRVGPQAIREYLGRMRERYAHAVRPTKGQLLDEVCEVTGYHRKAVIRSLRRPERPRRRRRGGPPVRYGPVVVGTLRRIWSLEAIARNCEELAVRFERTSLSLAD